MIYLLLTWLAAPWLWWRAMHRRMNNHDARILVIQTAKIGDFVATTPVFRALRMRFPHAEIVALIHPANAPLADGLSSIDRVLTLPPCGFKGWAGKQWLLAQLAEGYDATVVLSPNLSTLLVPFWAAVPQRVSVLPDRRQGSTRLAYPFLTHGEKHRPGRPLRETALRALAGLGITIDQQLLTLPNEVPRAPSGEARRETLLTEKREPFVGLGLGAGNRMKALSASQLKELALGIAGKTSATLVLIGTKLDQTVAIELVNTLPKGRALNTTDQWSLAELPSLLSTLDCFVGVDSGATYIADAVGVPVIDFMGPADADDQSPRGTHAIVVRSTEPCAPCSHSFDAPYKCHLGTRACIKKAPLAALLDQVKAIVVDIKKTPISVPPKP